MLDEKTYCEKCYENLDDDKFDYRFDFPICQKCSADKQVIELNSNCICTNEDETPSDDCFGCFDDAVGNLNYLLKGWKEVSGFVTDTIRIDGKNMGWSKDSGYAVTSIDKLYSALTLRGDYRIVFTLEGSTLTAERFSHDEPMGGAVFTFTPIEEEE